MTCTSCGSVATLDLGVCFSCDPTPQEVKEFTKVLQIQDILKDVDDYAAIERICSWAASKARNEIQESQSVIVERLQ